MRTALTVITTAILTAIAFLRAGQQGWLGNVTGAASCPIGAWVATDTPTTDCIPPTGTKSCTTPRGANIAHGTAVLSFKEEVGTGDTVCESMTSVCNDGIWHNDKTPYTYASCTLPTPTISTGTLALQPCQVGNIYVPHDSTNTFYKETKTTNGSYTYTSQKRYCFDGEMDGDASFTKLNLIGSCTIEVAKEAPKKEAPKPAPVVKKTPTPVVKKPATPTYARCTGPFGGIWEHGKAGTVYLENNVAYGQSCEAVSVVCGYGSIRYGTASNIGNPVGKTVYANCSVGEPASCSSNCGEVAHGQQITTYSNGSIPYGSDTTCNDVQITSTCSNGALSPRAGSACSCTVEPPAACTAPNGQVVAHNNALTLYQYPEVQAVAGDGSDTCVRQWRRCLNGTWHDYNGAPASFTFQYATCDVLPPPAGWGPGGEGIPQT